ncbi:DUF1667 domain-containing protein [Eubacteriales bacterium OttesenSCG-928-N14]|nr:DUF1667 domain-containing protein [Eubacteriales bacterium OttesenSCG-928-N14]
MTREFICIGCPMGCQLTATKEGEAITVTGAQCRRGVLYGQQELTDPRRTVTTIMRVAGKERPVSVRTSAPIPMRLIRDCLLAVAHAVAPPNTKLGDVLIANFADTGIDIIATRDA